MKMNHPRPAWRFVAVIPITLITLFVPALAAENDELALVRRQLDQVQAALERARVMAAQGDPTEGRFFFDYRQATSDLNTIRSGIDHYLAPSRAQPRRAFIGGNYRREQP